MDKSAGLFRRSAVLWLSAVVSLVLPAAMAAQTGTWTATTTTNAPAARSDATAVWTGSRMIVWGGSERYQIGFDWFTRTTNTGKLYDPATDSWTSISSQGAPAACQDHSAV